MDEIRSQAGAWWARLSAVARSAWTRTMRPTRAGPSDEAGQGLAEYALILSFIAIVAIAALAFFGLQVSNVLTDPVGAEISGVVDRITP